MLAVFGTKMEIPNHFIVFDAKNWDANNREFPIFFTILRIPISKNKLDRQNS